METRIRRRPKGGQTHTGISWGFKAPVAIILAPIVYNMNVHQGLKVLHVVGSSSSSSTPRRRTNK